MSLESFGSNSSDISPTISSKISSSVIKPWRLPYSSTTSAKWALRCKNCLIWSSKEVVSGTKYGFIATWPISKLFKWFIFGVSWLINLYISLAKSLAWITPTILSGSLRKTGSLVWTLSKHWVNILVGSSLELIISMFDRWSIISSTVLSERSNAPKMRSLSSFSTKPSEWPSWIAPAISSRTASMWLLGSVFTPKILNINLTRNLTDATIGDKALIINWMKPATLAAASSAFVMA